MWGFFFNSKSRSKGIGQIKCVPDDCPKALTKDCYLDVSGLKAMKPEELARATEFDPISERLYEILIAELTSGNDMLSEAHRVVALVGLQGS